MAEIEQGSNMRINLIILDLEKWVLRSNVAL